MIEFTALSELAGALINENFEGLTPQETEDINNFLGGGNVIVTLKDPETEGGCYVCDITKLAGHCYEFVMIKE